MFVYFIAVVLASVLQVPGSQWKSIDLDSARTQVETMRGNIALALVKSPELQSYLEIDDDQVMLIESSKAQLVADLRNKTEVAEISKPFLDHTDRVFNGLRYEQTLRSDVIVADVLLRHYAKDKWTHELLKPFVAVSIRNFGSSDTKQLTEKTEATLSKFCTMRESLSVEAIENITKFLSTSQREKFFDTAGSLTGSTLSILDELKDLDDSYHHCTEELYQAVETRSVEIMFPELELSALQVAKLWNGARTAETKNLLKGLLEYEKKSALVQGDRIDPVEATLKIEERVATIGLSCIRETLNTKQMRLLRQISARTYLLQSSRNILAWPSLLKDELELSDEEIGQLKAEMKLAKRSLETATEDLLSTLSIELCADLPMDLLSFLERLPKFSQASIVNESVFRAYRSHNAVQEARR